jgi:transposase
MDVHVIAQSKKVALIAVMRKLLVLAFGVLKSGKPFDINYQH